MTDSNYIIGTCEAMCPATEIELRTRNRLVHFYERDKVFVKEFSRSSADKKLAKPSELRTFGALRQTLDYLFNK
jgi:SAC3 domain-containing protein 1